MTEYIAVAAIPMRVLPPFCISAAELNKYFGKDATPREMKDQIMSLLAEWKEKQPPERTAPEKKTDREK